MKKGLFMVLCSTLLLLCVPNAFAIPTLQLDIGNGVYDAATETIVATGTSFSLYALLTPKRNDNVAALLAETYYISAAILPQTGPAAANLGSFTFDTIPIDVTADMTYGAPNGLPSHGVFPSYFTTFGFWFDNTDTVGTYNTQDHPGGFGNFPGSGSYFAKFEVDTALLTAGYVIHFDLYNLNQDGSAAKFAPFSHDAQSAPVPEPATLLLLGTGLIGLAGLGRKKFKK